MTGVGNLRAQERGNKGAAMLEARVIEVDKALAAKYLESSAGNRPISRTTVDAYAGLMRRGEWTLNGEGMQFDVDGNFLNGHHRCHAIIKSGVAVPVLVVTGCERDSFKTFDGGKRRCVADVLAIRGEINSVKLAAVTRSFALYKEPKRAGGEITPTLIIDYLERHPELRYWTQKHANNSTLKRFPSALAAMVTVASEKYGSNVMETFLDKLATGVGLDAGDPALLLRERFLNVSEKSIRLQYAMACALIIKAINAHIKGKKLGVLRYKPNEEPPVIE